MLLLPLLLFRPLSGLMRQALELGRGGEDDLVDAADEDDPDCDVVVTADEDDAPEVAVVAVELSFFVGWRG